MNDPNDYNGGKLVVISVLLLTLTYVSVGLRFSVRVWILKNFQLDDWCMLFAQVSAVCQLLVHLRIQVHAFPGRLHSILFFRPPRRALWTWST